jgi:hypothetical protein
MRAVALRITTHAEERAETGLRHPSLLLPRHSAIRERAYHFWLAAGRPNGNAEAYWFAAQREIQGVCLGSFAPETALEGGDKKPTKKAKAARKRGAS